MTRKQWSLLKGGGLGLEGWVHGCLWCQAATVLPLVRIQHRLTHTIHPVCTADKQQSHLSLGVCMLRMRQGLLAATAALASDRKASFTTLTTCTYHLLVLCESSSNRQPCRYVQSVAFQQNQAACGQRGRGGGAKKAAAI